SKIVVNQLEQSATATTAAAATAAAGLCSGSARSAGAARHRDCARIYERGRKNHQDTPAAAAASPGSSCLRTVPGPGSAAAAARAAGDDGHTGNQVMIHGLERPVRADCSRNAGAASAAAVARPASGSATACGAHR